MLRLSEGVEDAERTLDEYVVTPQLVRCFEGALSLIGSSVRGEHQQGAHTCTGASEAARVTSWPC